MKIQTPDTSIRDNAVKKLKPCPECGKDNSKEAVNLEIYEEGGFKCVRCLHCGFRGDMFETEWMAVNGWHLAVMNAFVDALKRRR